MKRGLNKADKTLLIVFGLFLLALYLHLRYPYSLVSDALLFASEAALVRPPACSTRSSIVSLEANL